MFISFEGVDGSGKSTQINLLKIEIERNGFECVLLEEPGTTLVGLEIRKILKDYEKVGELSPVTELFLFAASRSELVDKEIKPLLARREKVIIADRYIDSTLAYQGYGRGYDTDKINYINNIVTQGIKPDLTFLLDCSPSQSISRIDKSGSKDRFESEGLDFYQAIRLGYLEIAKLEPERLKVIDAELPIPDVASKIWEITKNLIKEY